jgi:hypothetical protein
MEVFTMTRSGDSRGWAYIGAVLGAGVSIAANVAHSYVPPPDAGTEWSPEIGAVLGSTFWPIALFVAVEILARVPWPPGRRWTALRFGGLLPVALVAAIVSYRHLSGLLAHYGEDHITCLIGPLAVDGIMIMATGALVATRDNTRAAASAESHTGPVALAGPAASPAIPPEPVSPGPGPTVPVRPAGRLRLPASMREVIETRAREVAAEGRPLTVEDIRAAVRVPESLAGQIMTELKARPVLSPAP